MSRPSAGPPGPLELETIRDEITQLTDQYKFAPLLLRLAFHDAFTFDSGSSTGGANGSIRNEKELGHTGNEGLSTAVRALQSVKDRHPALSYADLYQLAGIVALELAGGPLVPFRTGRRDSAVSPPQGRIPSLLDASGRPSLEMFKKAAKRAGLSHRRLLVLCGAHTLGRWWAIEVEGPPHLEKHYRGDAQFDNSYFRMLVAGQLPQDSILLEDPELKMIATDYARSQALFFQDYAAAHEQLSTLGTRLAGEQSSRPSSAGTPEFSIFDSSTWTATEYAVAGAIIVAGSALAAGWWIRRRRRMPKSLLNLSK